MPLLTTTQVDFPVGFAEIAPTCNQENVYHVEWLDNDSEFPGLPSNNTQVTTDDNWELLEQDEFSNWSKIHVFDVNSYVEIAEKNADELKPTKRDVQPLWPVQHKNENTNNIQELNDEDSDLMSLYYVRKGQAKIPQRSTHLHLKKDLRIIDYSEFPGTYLQGISNSKKNPTIPLEPPESGEYYPFESKKVALKYVATRNAIHYEIDPQAVWRHKSDNSEYSALHAQKERFRTKDEF